MVFDDNNLDTAEVTEEDVVAAEVVEIEEDDDDTEVEDLDLASDVIDESELDETDEEN